MSGQGLPVALLYEKIVMISGKTNASNAKTAVVTIAQATHPRHRHSYTSDLVRLSSNFATGAAKPPGASPCLYQTRSAVSMTSSDPADSI